MGNFLKGLLLPLWLAAGIAFAAETPLALTEVAPNVFVHEGELALMTQDNEGGIANVGVIVGEEAVAVIDSGGSARQGRRLLAAVREVTDKPIAYLINTHMHPDHLFGNLAFKEAGARILAHENLPDALAARGDFYLSAFRENMGDALMEETEIVGPDEVVVENKVLDIGGRQLLLQAWPTAHSDNDLTVLDQQTSTLFAGDLVFVDHVPIVDGSLPGFLEVTQSLAAVPAARVVPGHGPVSDWPDPLDAQTRYLKGLADELREMIARGLPIEQAAAQAGRAEAGRWSLFDAYNARNATAGYAELEWE